MRIICILCAYVLVSGEVSFVVANPDDEAIQLLSTSRPMHDPALEIGFADVGRSESAKKLFESQMNALSQLKGKVSSTSIPLLVTYLNYSTTIATHLPKHLEPPNSRPTADVQTLSVQWPAFAAIVSTPRSDEALVKYLTNDKNPLDERVAAFQVLRYINIERFHDVSTDFVNGIVTHNPARKRYLDAVVDGTCPFEGIYPLSIVH